eukprot:5909896-Pleurochrysis_carterae.AAC.3
MRAPQAPEAVAAAVERGGGVRLIVVGDSGTQRPSHPVACSLHGSHGSPLSEAACWGNETPRL